MTDDGSVQGRPPLDLRIDGVTAVLGGANGEQYEIRPATRIGVRDGRIASIEPMTAAPEPAARAIDGTGHAAIPGMICTHDHVFQNLIKGLGDELEVWPIVEGVILATAEEMTPEETYIGALAACVEGLKSGTTAVLDFMVGRPEIEQHQAVVRAFRDSGARGFLGRATRELHHEAAHRDPWYIPLEEALAQITQVASEYDNGLGVPSALPAPGNPRTMTTEGLVRVAEYARERGCLITIHLAEYDEERQQGVDRWGRPTIAALDELGFLGPNVVAAHSVLVDDDEIGILARTGTKVSYNPVSNAYCGVGVAPVLAMLEAGVGVSLAVDGSAVNVKDMLQSLKFGALLQKVATRDARAINARDMLRMATVGGAEALGVPDELGVIGVGRRADLSLFDLRRLNVVPVHDVISAIVYASAPENIRTVIVGGRVVVEDGRSTLVDEAGLIRELEERSVAVARRTGTTRFTVGRRFTPFGSYEQARRPRGVLTRASRLPDDAAVLQ
jgi:5-methylthioadenosine/S-adenosylhomocysteine deaminase